MGRAAELPNRGDYICRTINATPVFVIRQRDGSICAFDNTCLHRGARLLCGDGHVSRISCPYHSWTYELDGQLIGAPFMEQTPGFDVKNYHLRQVVCEEWEGFVYVSLQNQPQPLAGQLQELHGLIGDFRIADYVPVYAIEEIWHANWKCLVENFMDAYHIHRVHKNSFAKYGSSEDITHLYPGSEAFTYHLIQESEDRRSVYPHPENTWLTGDDRYKTYLINIFPSHVIQLQPDMMWYLSILPAGVDRLSIRWAVSMPGEILNNATIRQDVIDEEMDLIHQVNSEDKEIVYQYFANSKSPQAIRGPLSYLERNLWDFGRYLARRLAN